MTVDGPAFRQLASSQATATGGAGAARPAASAPVRVWAHLGAGAGLQENVPLERVSELLSDPRALVWVDLADPNSPALDMLGEECRLHPLALEDAQQRHERPKVDEYEHFYYAVFYVAEWEPTTAAIRTHEVSLFFGERFLVTVHSGPVAQIEESVRRWRENADELGYNIGTLLYALLDSMVDSYFPIVDEIGDLVDDLHEAIFAHPNRQTLQQLSLLRRDLLRVRRVLAPEREVINTLLRRDRPILPANSMVYFHDVYDHVVRLIETIDTYREMLSGALESYLSATSNNLNEVMKTLTSWSIILMSGALIAGIYGMNFRLMPELEWRFGYPLALALMLAVSLGLFIYFRRRGWL